jgi:quercetin dioxygenase-like cupin family protein
MSISSPTTTSKTLYGFTITYVDTPLYAARALIILENQATAYIYHKKQDLTIFVSQGRVLLTVEGRTKILNEGDSYHLSPKIMFRLAALQGDTTILEVGTKLEDDVVEVDK